MTPHLSLTKKHYDDAAMAAMAASICPSLDYTYTAAQAVTACYKSSNPHNT